MSNKLRKILSLFFKKNSAGLAQIPLMVGLLIMAIAVPVATKLVEQNQENRGMAASCSGQTCSGSKPCCTGFKCIGGVCKKTEGGGGSTATCDGTNTASACRGLNDGDRCTGFAGTCRLNKTDPSRGCGCVADAPTNTPAPKTTSGPTATTVPDSGYFMCDTTTKTCISLSQSDNRWRYTSYGQCTANCGTGPTSAPCGASGQVCCLTEYVLGKPVYNTCNSGLYCNGGSCGKTPVPTVTSAPKASSTPVPSGCAKEGEYSYSGKSCCSGLQGVECQGEGTFKQCICRKPVATPTLTRKCDEFSENGCKGVNVYAVCAPSSGAICVPKSEGGASCACRYTGPATRECTQRTCGGLKCNVKTVTVPGDQGCPPSDCLYDSECESRKDPGGDCSGPDAGYFCDQDGALYSCQRSAKNNNGTGYGWYVKSLCGAHGMGCDAKTGECTQITPVPTKYDCNCVDGVWKGSQCSDFQRNRPCEQPTQTPPTPMPKAGTCSQAGGVCDSLNSCDARYGKGNYYYYVKDDCTASGQMDPNNNGLVFCCVQKGSVPSPTSISGACAKEGESSYYGKSCCTGLDAVSCEGSGTFKQCVCAKPGTVPTVTVNPSVTQAQKSCYNIFTYEECMFNNDRCVWSGTGGCSPKVTTTVTKVPTQKVTSPPGTNPTNIPTKKATNTPVKKPTNPPGTNCKEECPGKDGILRNCTPPEGDGTSQDSVCNTAGRKESCGGKDYCCPSAGGKWTTDLTACKPKAGACTECPKEFKCYVSSAGDEYKWFVDGYVMAGFKEVNGNDCAANEIFMPDFLGKTNGDANCDGTIDISDYSLWHKEFYDGDAGAVVKSNWNADFTGPEGVCDGRVNISDYSLWHKYFYELMGNN